MALSPTRRFSLVGFFVMMSQVGCTGVGAGAGAGAGIGAGAGVGVGAGEAGVSAPPSATGFGTGKTSVGSLVPRKTS